MFSTENTSYTNGLYLHLIGEDGVGPKRTRGRPRITVTEEVLENTRRLSRQRSNARRPKSKLL